MPTCLISSLLCFLTFLGLFGSDVLYSRGDSWIASQSTGKTSWVSELIQQFQPIYQKMNKCRQKKVVLIRCNCVYACKNDSRHPVVYFILLKGEMKVAFCFILVLHTTQRTRSQTCTHAGRTKGAQNSAAPVPFVGWDR